MNCSELMAPTRRAPLRGERSWRRAAPSEIFNFIQLQYIFLLKYIFFLMNYRELMAPTRRAPLRGERSWRRAAPSEIFNFI